MRIRPSTVRSPWVFFAVAFGVSWLFWIPAALSGRDVTNSPWALALYAGGAGPAVAAVLLVVADPDPARRRDYLRRVVDPRRIGGRWYVVALGLYPTLVVTAGSLLGGVGVADEIAGAVARPAGLAALAVSTFVFGPLPEELGWRGVALDGLLDRLAMVPASLLLGAVWGLWHLPLFVMAGTYQHGLGLGTATFWRFMASTTVLSVLFTWLYLNTRRSILSAVLLHFSINLTGTVLVVADAAQWLVLGAVAVLAAAVAGRARASMAGREVAR